VGSILGVSGVLLAPRSSSTDGKPTRQTRPVDRDAPARLSILIVDDVDDTRELYERFMQFQGARVTTARDGLEALQSVTFDKPDVIVLDLAMPRMTGWETIRNLRANRATAAIPIIVVSGQRAKEEALEAGADSYLEKPCLPNELLTEVLRVLREPTRRRGPRDQ
jgi:two-component system cell cycle response regulator DivK